MEVTGLLGSFIDPSHAQHAERLGSPKTHTCALFFGWGERLHGLLSLSLLLLRQPALLAAHLHPKSFSEDVDINEEYEESYENVRMLFWSQSASTWRVKGT